MKKSVFVALIAVFVLGLAGVALAGTPVAVTNGELKASYMVWPKIVRYGRSRYGRHHLQ